LIISRKGCKAKKLHFWLDQILGEAQSLDSSLYRWYNDWGQVKGGKGWTARVSIKTVEFTLNRFTVVFILMKEVALDEDVSESYHWFYGRPQSPSV